MKLSALLHRSRPELPGLAGTARVDRRTGRCCAGSSRAEIAVLDQVDLDRATADALVAAEVVAVVNASPSVSGRFPTLGAGGAAGRRGRPRRRGRARRAARHPRRRAGAGAGRRGVRGGEELARGVEQTADSVADALAEAKAGCPTSWRPSPPTPSSSCSASGRCSSTGPACPDVEVELAGRQVLVVAAGPDHAADLAQLRRYIREYRPVLVGVGAGATRCARPAHPRAHRRRPRRRSRTRR
jgi:uncharacterized membrane-anchored protein